MALGDARSERSYLSIGEVLNLLKEEFPDITISKIRFLESQGLLEPERTPSGYRKFYQQDVERLRYILAEQKENFLPLKVIRRQLDGSEGAPAVRRLHVDGAPEAEPHEPDELTSAEGAGVAYAIEELAAVSGIGVDALKELEKSGMLNPRHTVEGRVYGDDDLRIARLCKAFARYGLEPRHLRMYKHFAEREASVFEQIALPMLRQRNPEARKLAHSTLGELAGLSREIKQALLRAELRAYLEE